MHLSRRWSALACCLVLAIVHTWPLVLDPGTYSRNDNADTQLNEWIMAWVAHQLPRDPAGPVRGQHLLSGTRRARVLGAARSSRRFSAPRWRGPAGRRCWSTTSCCWPVSRSARFATCLVVERWTGSLAAGLVAGSLFAFNTHTLHRLPHMQALHLYGLPVALYALDSLARSAVIPRGAAARGGARGDGLHVGLPVRVRLRDDRGRGRDALAGLVAGEGRRRPARWRWRW